MAELSGMALTMMPPGSKDAAWLLSRHAFDLGLAESRYDDAGPMAQQALKYARKH